MHHAQPEAGAIAASAQVPFRPLGVLPWSAGVDVFFVISGFIIVHASAPLYGTRGGRRRFLAHRLARLVPLYWLVSAAYLALAVAVPSVLSGIAGGDHLDPGYVIASFLFWPASRPDGVPVPLYGLGWTLNCEMFFYALFALGLGWGRRGAVAWLVASLAALALARAAAPDMPMPFAFWTSPLILEFALGAALGLARAEGVRLGRGVRLALAAAGLGLLAAVPEPDLALHPVFYGLPGALLVASAALGGETVPGARRRWLPVLVAGAVALGDASYALYLTHPFVLRATRETIARLGLAPSVGPWGSLAIMVVLAALASVLVYRLAERPLTRRARRLLDPAPRGAPAKTLDESRHHVSREAKRI